MASADANSMGSNSVLPIVMGRETAAATATDGNPNSMTTRAVPIWPLAIPGETTTTTATPTSTGPTTMTVNHPQYSRTISSSSSSRPNKGFSTSICSIFSNPNAGRVDCCSMACCGVLQADRNRYLLTGKLPPSPFKRACIHIIIPLSIFMIAGYSALHISNSQINEAVCTMLILFLFLYVITGCIKGRAKRVALRRDILFTMRDMDELQHHYDNNNSNNTNNNYRAASTAVVPPPSAMNRTSDDNDDDNEKEKALPQTSWEMHCAHRICGFYTSDIAPSPERDRDSPGDLCHCLMRFFSDMCCLGCCGCWLQFCGCCALAQEGREIERIVPPQRRRIDYVTMEPFVEYYEAIRALRLNNNGSFREHYKALSELSIMLLKSLGIVIGGLLVLSFLGNNGFNPGNFAVFVATLCQAFAIMLLVHWLWNKFDLSLDAVIKYFACGFILCIGLAFFFEIIESIIINFLLAIIVSLSNIGIVDDEGGYQMGGLHGFGDNTMMMNDRRMLSSFNAYLLGDHEYDMKQIIRGTSLDAFGKRHPGVMIIVLAIRSYAMAALVEEICKYFGYVMVEHPDFLSDEDLAEAAAAPPLPQIDTGDEEESEDENNNNNATTAAAAAAATGDASSKRFTFPFMAMGSSTNTTAAAAELAEAKEIPPSFLPPTRRTYVSVGSGITIAMVAVAMGFACCENLIYIFVYSGSSLASEIAVLIARSLFPIHPISAAIQSIGVCRRDLENDKSSRMGRIILPALLFHGSFDFILMLIAFFERTYVGQYGSRGGGLLSLALGLVVLLCGVGYYIVEGRAQRHRLKTLDDSVSSLGAQSRLI